jgi:hypothetical protein
MPMMSSAAWLNLDSMFSFDFTPFGELEACSSTKSTIRSAHGPKHRSTIASTYFRCKLGATALRRIFQASFS